jgi:hypothetical protein
MRRQLAMSQRFVTRFKSALLQLRYRASAVIFRKDPELPANEIATMLGITLPLLVRRMEIGELPSRCVGADRCARLSDVLDLKKKIDSAQRAIREMAEIAEKNGEL